MKKFTLTLGLLLFAVIGIKAEVVIWEGTQAGNLDFKVGEDLHTTLMNNVKAGDVLNISYTGAGSESKLWLQDSDWTTYDNSVTGATTDILTPGNGVYTVTMSQEFIDGIKTRGLKLRRGGETTYSFTKVTVTAGATPQPDEPGSDTGIITIWEGTSAESIYIAPGSDLYNKLIGDASGQANLATGDKIKFYYTGAEEGTEIWLQANWDGLSGEGSMPSISGDGSCEFYINEADLAKIKEAGLRFRIGKGSCTFTKIEVVKPQQGGGQSADEITIWEGTSTESIYIAPGSDLYNKLFGDASGQANLATGDKIKFYYTGAEEGTEIWLQANWDGLSGEGSMPSISGDGSCEFYINEADLAKIKEAGLRFRIGKGSCTFTKIEVVKPQQGGGQSADEITIWEGASTESLRFWPGSTNYDLLVAKLGAMDIIKFYYTGAAEGDQVWFQNNEWNNLANIDPATPTIAAGDGSYEFTVNEKALAEIVEKGIMLRRPNSSSYTFTKVVVVKYVPDASVIVPGDDETVLWSGSVKANSGKAFRYGDERANFIAALSVGKFLNVYMSDVVEGNQIYFKDVTTWGWLNEDKLNLTPGQQVYSYQITQDMIDKINVGSGDYGLLIQGKSTDEYEIRYVTISDKEIVTDIISDMWNEVQYDNQYFNLKGQRVNANTKGLIIVNGKKFFNK